MQRTLFVIFTVTVILSCSIFFLSCSIYNIFVISSFVLQSFLLSYFDTFVQGHSYGICTIVQEHNEATVIKTV